MNEVSASETLVKSAYGVLKRVLKNLEGAYQLKSGQVEAIVLVALQQHGEHLKTHQIEQKSIDAFKLVCWLGGGLLEGVSKGDDAQSGAIIDALIKTLRELLYIESEKFLKLPGSSAALLKSLLLQEKHGNSKHGIWMNGLYMSFHCSITSWREGRAWKIPL